MTSASAEAPNHMNQALDKSKKWSNVRNQRTRCNT